MKHNLELLLRADVEAAKVALRAADAAALKYQALQERLGALNGEAVEFIMNARNVLRCFLGKPGNASWQQAGFPPGAFAVPSTMPARFKVVHELETHFQANPDRQMPALKVTSEIAAGLYERWLKVTQGLNQSRADLAAARKTRGSAVQAISVTPG